VVFVACVVVELEKLKPPVVVAAALPSVAEPDADALSVVLPLDVEALDCADDRSAVVLGEDDWESGDKACQLGNHTYRTGTYYCSERSAVSGLSPRCLHVSPATAKPLRKM
jgi:hypothetical protein